MNKLVFSSDELAGGLDDQARFNAWRDVYLGTVCNFDVERATELPFSMRYEFLNIGEVGLSTCVGTVHRIKRTPQHVARDDRDIFFFSINGLRPWSIDYRGRSHAFAPHAVSFLSNDGPGDSRHDGGTNWQGMVLPRSRISELVQHPDDLVGCTIDPDSEVLRHLKRYIAMLLDSGELGTAPALAGHIETTLFDLTALLLNGRRDAVDLARVRGLRAARLQAIFAEIGRGFARREFSPRTVALKLGLSVNYVQKLLYDTGVTFTERVLELRLQKGRAMLTDARHSALKVSEVALECGFNEVSYFNRCFRRRFGESPTQCRGKQ